MCRAGGRRCPGSGGGSKSKNSMPSRQDVDQMAAGMSADRKGWDGAPLDDKGRRLYALRESGYNGPIDQDGYAVAADVATAPARPASASASVPTREDADRLAAELPASRRGWDGSPLNEKDKRFFGLRDSGYTGPIDQHGYPDTTSDDAATLRRMARDRGETVNW